MAEFKVNKALVGEISSLQCTGEQLSSASSVDCSGVSSLKTSVRFVSEHNAIIELLKLYQRLVKKEVTDLNAMVESAEELDAKLSGK